MLVRRLLPALAFLAASGIPALGQDFGTDWIDRVTHEIEPAKAPIDARPLETTVWMGVLYYYDTNTLLDPSATEPNAVLVPFLRGRLDYAEPHLDVAGDLLVDYRQYFQDHKFSDFDERAYGRLRYEGTRVSAEIAEIFRHESDPIDAVFDERARRYVSNTLPRLTVDVRRVFAIEVNANVQAVYFDDAQLDASDNWSLRADVAGVYRLKQDLEALLQVGVLGIDYVHTNGPPDAMGGYAHVGARGQLVERLMFSALVGLAQARSQSVPLAAGGGHERLVTGDISLNVRFEALPGLVLQADLTRQIGFSQGVSSFEVVTRWLGIAEYQFNDAIMLRARFQYDSVDPMREGSRSYFSVGPSATYALASENRAALDLGVTFRGGDTGGVGDSRYHDVIAHVGLVISR